MATIFDSLCTALYNVSSPLAVVQQAGVRQLKDTVKVLSKRWPLDTDMNYLFERFGDPESVPDYYEHITPVNGVYSTLSSIVEQLLYCEYQTADGLHNLRHNAAFISLQRIAETEKNNA